MRVGKPGAQHARLSNCAAALTGARAVAPDKRATRESSFQ